MLLHQDGRGDDDGSEGTASPRPRTDELDEYVVIARSMHGDSGSRCRACRSDRRNAGNRRRPFPTGCCRGGHTSDTSRTRCSSRCRSRGWRRRTAATRAGGRMPETSQPERRQEEEVRNCEDRRERDVAIEPRLQDVNVRGLAVQERIGERHTDRRSEEGVIHQGPPPRPSARPKHRGRDLTFATSRRASLSLRDSHRWPLQQSVSKNQKKGLLAKYTSHTSAATAPDTRRHECAGAEDDSEQTPSTSQIEEDEEGADHPRSQL